MFSIIKDFIGGLSDIDFLSMVDHLDFYNKRITMKHFYWQKLFQIILEFVEIKKRSEKDLVASSIKKVMLWRLGTVSATSFRRYFTQRIHTKKDFILEELRKIRSEFRKSLNLHNSEPSVPSPSIKQQKKKKSKKNKSLNKTNGIIESQLADHLSNDHSLNDLLLSAKREFGIELRFVADSTAKECSYNHDLTGPFIDTIILNRFDYDVLLHEIAHLLRTRSKVFPVLDLTTDDQSHYHDEYFQNILNHLVEDFYRGENFNNTLSYVGLIQQEFVQQEERNQFEMDSDDELYESRHLDNYEDEYIHSGSDGDYHERDDPDVDFSNFISIDDNIVYDHIDNEVNPSSTSGYFPSSNIWEMD